jgi:hypothetical protein
VQDKRGRNIINKGVGLRAGRGESLIWPRFASTSTSPEEYPRKHCYHSQPLNMKPASPLSLLLFLHLVSAIPIPIKNVLFATDCHYSSCAPSLRTAIILAKPNTPPTTLTEPHFPSHQLSSKQLIEETYDNAPRTPPKQISASKALSASHPLSSSYLLSLANPASPPHPDATSHLPSKPTSELPNLRKEDAQRYWASSREKADSSITLVEIQASQAIKLCGHEQDQYLRIQGAYLAREYSDLMVVGIVVLFLAVVVALEACERLGDL